MQITSPTFKANAHNALRDSEFQQTINKVGSGFIGRRTAATEALPEFDELRDNAKAIKDHVLGHLDIYLEAYEKKVEEAGGKVHWAETAAEARGIRAV